MGGRTGGEEGGAGRGGPSGRAVWSGAGVSKGVSMTEGPVSKSLEKRSMEGLVNSTLVESAGK